MTLETFFVAVVIFVMFVVGMMFVAGMRAMTTVNDKLDKNNRRLKRIEGNENHAKDPHNRIPQIPSPDTTEF